MYLFVVNENGKKRIIDEFDTFQEAIEYANKYIDEVEAKMIKERCEELNYNYFIERKNND